MQQPLLMLVDWPGMLHKNTSDHLVKTQMTISPEFCLMMGGGIFLMSPALKS